MGLGSNGFFFILRVSLIKLKESLMSILIWSESLRVNFEAIDSQHQKLFDLANAFYIELYNGAEKPILAEKLKDLTDYAILHFKMEEDLLFQYNHPDATIHAREHAEFVDELTRLNSRMEYEGLVISVGVINFLRNSIINHIFVSDKNMAKYFVATDSKSE